MDLTDLLPLAGQVPQLHDHLPAIALGLFVLHFACSAIDAAFPQPPAGSPWVPIRQLISLVALARGHAANAVPAGAVPAPVAKAAAEVQQLADDVTQAAGTLKAASLAATKEG